MKNDGILKKSYLIYGALKKSEKKILNEEVHWKEGLQFSRWDWRQGVGLYGIWKLYEATKDLEILRYLEGYIERRISEGQPLEKHVNTVCPMLTVIHIYEETRNEKYLPLINEWLEWILSADGLPKTEDNGFQHYCGAKTPNPGQLWDDTLFMTVLFLGKAGMVLGKPEYIDAAYDQFMIHAKYLTDEATGLWYHVFTFEGNHHYSKALWGRGNAWVTASIPEFLEITKIEGKRREELLKIFKHQVHTLIKLQDKSGMWHTLLNEESSYLEATATAGIGYGLLKAIRLGFIENAYLKEANLAYEAIFQLVDESGYLRKASDGTPLGLDLDFYRQVPLNTRAYAQGLSLMIFTEKSKV